MMAPFRTLAALGLSLGVASGFAPASNVANRQATSLAASKLDITSMFDYDDAVKDFENQFPQFSKWGWGPSVQAEKWNGRHAMFGWLLICATAYAKGHGLIPDPDAALNFKEWGTLATISGMDTITNERALILIANVHFFAVSLLATICPLPFGDPLLIDPAHPSYDKLVEQEKNPYGYMPSLKPGINDSVEILHGRLAMLGIATLIFATAYEQKPMLDIVNEWVGGAYY